MVQRTGTNPSKLKIKFIRICMESSQDNILETICPEMLICGK